MHKIILAIFSLFLILSFHDSFCEKENTTIISQDYQVPLEMVYPFFGDSYSYLVSGRGYADHLREFGFAETPKIPFYGVRPWGMRLYSSLPFLLTKDPVLINYYVLLFNFIVAVIIISFFLNYFDCNKLSFKSISMISGLSICLVPFLPILMSDAISLLFFILGIYYIGKVSINLKKGIGLTFAENMMLFVSGLMFAISVTMKQNYFVYSLLFFLSFIFVYKAQIFTKSNLKSNAISSIFMLIGFSFCLTQFYFVYYHAGIFWFYNPSAFGFGTELFYQPYLELIAYTLPKKSSYMLELKEKVNGITFVLLKLYLGMSKVYLPIYHGFMPTATVIYKMSSLKTLKVYLFFVMLAAFTVYTYKRGSEMSKALILTAFFITIFAAMGMHTENRYYLAPRIIYLMFFIDFCFSFIQTINCKSLAVWRKNE